MDIKNNARKTFKKLFIQTGKTQINSWSSHFFHQVLPPAELEYLKTTSCKSK